MSFGYDGFGRRARKTDSTVVLKYIYDGSQLATIDSANIQIQTFTFYPGSETPHSVQRNTGNRQYYLTEIGAGSVWGLTDSTAAVKNHYRYAPFGLLEDSSEVVKNPLRFTGREYDPETRLYFNRARYYDPELARFISEDPIGQNGGANQYVYVGDDPINAVDPSGTDCASFDGSSYVDGGGCSRGGGVSLGHAGGDIGWDAANGGIEDTWSYGGVIDPTTGGVVYSGAEAVGVLLGLPGVELVKHYGTSVSCGSSASQVMDDVEGNFTQYGDYSRLGGLESVQFFPPADMGLGSTIPILVYAFGYAEGLSVNVQSMDSRSMTFTTNPGHLLYPAQITFGASQAGSGIDFNIDIEGTVAQPLRFRAGGGDFEDAQWHHFLGQVQDFCGGGQ